MNLYSFYLNNYEIIYFVYGLFFFLMGFAITMQIWNFHSISSLKLAKSLWLLAAFGLSHGLAEWSFVFLPLQTKNFGEAFWVFEFFQYFTIALSFLFLFYFGVKLLIDLRRVNHLFIYLPAVLFLVWFFSFITFRFISPQEDLRWWMLISETWIRYLLAFPGSLACSWAFYLEYLKFKKFSQPSLTNNFKYTSLTFILYAIVAGLVVPDTGFFPAFFINTANFIKIFSIPVQLIRALCGMLMAYYVIRGLAIFEYENRKRLELIQGNNMLLEERNRISRDLHDGIIQSIYAVGLTMDNAIYLNRHGPTKVQRLLERSIEQLDDVVVGIRQYIMNLRPNNFEETDLITGFSRFIENFRVNSLIYAEFHHLEQASIIVNEELASHLYNILSESLTNIAKHSQATEVQVSLVRTPMGLEIDINDNGIGFDSAIQGLNRGEGGTRQGLANILERIQLLRGQVTIDSALGKGTKIKIKIPCGGGLNDENPAS